jgi:DedD protein
MSFEIPEQAKYRLTGGVILIIIAAFVLPGLMKKSNQRFEENLAMHLKVPPKPSEPELNIPSAKQVFKQIKPSVKSQTPQVVHREVKVQLSKAHHLAYGSYLPTIPEAKPIVPPKPEVAKVEPSKSKSIEPSNRLGYGVQLASFSHSENATFLIQRLKKLGYDAKAYKLSTKNGFVYQVIVGKLTDKNQAIALQKQLAQNFQLQGMIVNKGMS